MPRYQHGHESRFAFDGAEFRTKPSELFAVAGNIDAYFIGFRSWCKPDEDFHGIQLTEENMYGYPSHSSIPVSTP